MRKAVLRKAKADQKLSEYETNVLNKYKEKMQRATKAKKQVNEQ